MRAGVIGLATQSALGHAYARHVEQYAHVAGQPASPWVGIAGAVKHDDVRAARQLRPGRQDRRGLAKGQQAGHVRESRPAANGRLLDHLEPRKPQDDNRGEDPGRSSIVRHVHGGHEPGRSWRAIPGNDLVTQPLLETDGLLRGDVPVVKAAGVHGVKRQV